MARVTNPVGPAGDIAAGITNIARALFAGPSPNALAEREQRLAATRSKIALDEARRGEAEQKTQALLQAADAVRQFTPNFAANRAGLTIPQVEAFQGYQQSGAWPEGHDAAWATPDVQQQLRDALAAASAYVADDQRNPADIAKLLFGLQDVDVTSGAARGAVDPAALERIGAARGALKGEGAYKDLSGSLAGTVNQFFGGVQVPDIPANRAIVEKDRAAAGASVARGRASDASAELSRARAERERARAAAGPKPPKPRKTLSQRDLAGALRTTLGVGKEGSDLVGEDAADVMALAQRIYQQPDSAIPEGDAVGAVQAALRALTGASNRAAVKEDEEVTRRRWILPNSTRDVLRLNRAGGGAPSPTAPASAASGQGVTVTNW